MSTTPSSNSNNKQPQKQDTYSSDSSEENLEAAEERRRRILKNRSRLNRPQHNMSGGGGAAAKHDGKSPVGASTSGQAATSSGVGGRLQAGPPERISMLVDGVRFTVEQSLLTAHPTTMLGTMFGSGFQFAHANERGEYDVADGISHLVFRAILEYYKSGVIRCPPTVSVPELKEACDYLLIPFDATTVRCQNLSEYKMIAPAWANLSSGHLCSLFFPSLPFL